MDSHQVPLASVEKAPGSVAGKGSASAHTNGALFVTIEVYENGAIAPGCCSPHAVRSIGAAD